MKMNLLNISGVYLSPVDGICAEWDSLLYLRYISTIHFPFFIYSFVNGTRYTIVSCTVALADPSSAEAKRSYAINPHRF